MSSTVRAGGSSRRVRSNLAKLRMLATPLFHGRTTRNAKLERIELSTSQKNKWEDDWLKY